MGASHLRFSLHIGATGSHVPHRSLDQAHATFTPDITHPVSRLLVSSSQDNHPTLVLMPTILFDASSMGCLRCLLLVMCTYPFAKKALTLHLACGEGRARHFGCNLMQRKVLALSHQHLMAEAPNYGRPAVCRSRSRRHGGAGQTSVAAATHHNYQCRLDEVLDSETKTQVARISENHSAPSW